VVVRRELADDRQHRVGVALIVGRHVRQAFDLAQEKPELRDRYGRNRFGQSCLLARRLVETGGIEEFARLHGIAPAQAKTLVEQGGTLEVGEEVLACQIVNGQPAVARFSAKNYLKAKELAASTHVHLMDALSEVAYADPAMMRGLVRKELTGGRP